MGLIEGKVAIVTGGGQGLGAAVCKKFATEGASVAILGRTFSKVEKVAEEIKAQGLEATAFKCDVSNRAEVDEVVKAVVEKYGKIDVLANNAAVEHIGMTLMDSTEEQLMDGLKNNVLGTFNMMQACFPYLKETKGHVINYGSAAGTQGRENQATYAATKEAVRGLSKSASAEWGKYEINVNVICPVGSSPAWEGYKAKLSEEQLAQTFSEFAIKRMGDPDTDIANVVLFLASDLSNYMTGRTLFADGGRANYK